MNRYLIRSVYNKIGSRALKVLIIKTLSLLKIPVYRVAIDTNNNCNLRCIMCYMSLDELREKALIMNEELFESIAKQIFPKTGFLDLSCSFEPFMTKNLINYLRISRNYCRGHISLCTNALLMNENIIKAIFKEQLLDEISISMDGIKEETYNSIRKGGKFSDLLIILNNLKKERAQRNSTKPVFRLNYTLLKRNLNELSDIYDFANEYGFSVVQLRHAKLTKHFHNLFEESLFFHQKESDSVIKRIKAQFRSNGNIRFIYPIFFSNQTKPYDGRATCAYPWFNFIISGSGNIDMCKIGSIGNLAERPFDEILSSNPVKQVRSQLLKGSYEDICGNCFTVSDLGGIRDKRTYIREDLSLL